MQMASTRKVISKACDACRRRKIKCNGQQPCSGCMSAHLICAYDSPRKQGGNRGARATVLNELRGSQAQVAATHSPASASSEPIHSPLSALYTSEDPFIQTCIDAYMYRIHPIVPILTRQALNTEVQLARSSLASRQFILAFCAYVANFGNALEDAQIEHQIRPAVDLGRRSLDEALGVQDAKRITDPNPRSMLISFFLYGAYAGLGDYQQGWFYLREATTLYVMLRKETISWYDHTLHSCAFWIFLISERYMNSICVQQRC